MISDESDTPLDPCNQLGTDTMSNNNNNNDEGNKMVDVSPVRNGSCVVQLLAGPESNLWP